MVNEDLLGDHGIKEIVLSASWGGRQRKEAGVRSK